MTRQGAKAFNQPLSLDTSSVTDMSSMFDVRLPPRSCRAPGAPQPVPLYTLRAPPPHPRVALLMCLCLMTRQRADAFNQPLSLDTSSVTDMYRMFNVRLPPRARAVHPAPYSRFLCTRYVHCHRPRVCPPHVPLFDDSGRAPRRSTSR